jgi:hypothetical protein
MRSSSLAAIASRQHGLLTRAQLRAAGWNRHRIEHAVRRWQIVLPEVYLVTDCEVNHDVRAAAALLRWPDALLSHTSSAYFLGWPVLDELPAWPKWLPDEHWPNPSFTSHVRVDCDLQRASWFTRARRDRRSSYGTYE